MIDVEISPDLEQLVLAKILEKKQYLYELEERIAALGNGEAEVKFYVRTGVVEKMEFGKAFENWFKPKVDLTSPK